MQEQNNSQKSDPNNPQIESDGVSMPIHSANQEAWPPPNIRDEIVQSAQEDVAQHQQGQAQQTSPTSTKTQADNNQITSDGTSMPIANTNENAWPPPNIREEVVESADKEENPHQQGQA